ncbi:phytanoyl-CoA dioxygenase family protein [Paenibacillus macquariensis]|uniref:Phytanoyl-CoA dioxygenase (PhyH) n=1 Tax=Paenibacillus macquariensis TaxID=948756 RepID=A0ABY1JKV8_9BACL|nr:phytanoyl-CoA dioxygenase family protein [Paenibacillus macquariensis]MEC0090027.1 phytanoyl-CoA dioxygenase family protein [Paenibacillus macquariensis]OAB31090.1 hypothetical protein PMSM_20410 [Paenibacillus macquariensis subsp. macquariensis]SIQ36365.1 Phytanoyl-CoA dioxygenase (PhyH) [Paenibacillus macquariensis]
MKWQTEEEISKFMYKYDQTYTPIQNVHQFSNDQVVEYKDTGFFAIDPLFSSKEVTEAADGLMNLLLKDVKGAKLQFTKPQDQLHTDLDKELAIRKIYDFVEEETLHAIAYHPTLLGVLEIVLGEKPVLVQHMALMKPPHGGGEKPWHQDMAFGPLAFNKSVIGVWIALDEATIDNGCMHIIPGSQKEGCIPHYAERDWQICDSSVQVDKDVVVPLSPGGTLFFHGLIHHGTPSNQSAKGRRALQFHFAPESALKMSPQEYKRAFTNEMTDAQC